MPGDQSFSFGVVAIGRNEGERLKQCLRSVSNAAQTVYVDSGSSDESVQWAKQTGVDVVELDAKSPFTAARARNAGFRRLRQIAPDIQFVQFIDGDCELNGSWPSAAIAFMQSHERVCAVLGRLQEALSRSFDLQPDVRSRVGCSDRRSARLRRHCHDAP